MSIVDVSLQAEDSEALKQLGLVDHCVKVIRVVQDASLRAVSVLVLLAGEGVSGGLSLEVGRLKNFGALQHLGLNGVGLKADLETPLLDFLAVCDHVVELANRADTVVRLLEEGLAHGSHGLLVLTHLLGDTDKHAQLGRQVDVLSLLLDLKERLVERHNLLVVLLTEVLHHRNSLALFALLEAARLRAHIPAHGGYLVGLVMTVASHDDGMLELVIDCLVDLVLLGGLASEPLLFVGEAVHLFINQLQAVVNREILRDVIDDKVNASLEDPAGSEEAGPGLDGVVEYLCLAGHEEAGVATDLAQFGIAHLSLDDGVDETECEWVLLHFHGVEIVKGKFAHALNADDEFAAEVGLLRLKVDLLVDEGGREDVVTHTDVINED